MPKLKKPDVVLDELDYNTLRPTLLFSEYGRNVKSMVEQLTTLDDRDKRNQMAQLIVQTMGLLNPGNREQADYKQKFWDHLHAMTGNALDIDSPYPKPELERLVAKPQAVNYLQNRVRYRYYGKSVEKMIERAAEMEEGDQKNEFIKMLGSFMKTSCKNWNDENVSDQAIIDQINELSNDKLNLASDGFQFMLEGTRYTAKEMSTSLGMDDRKKFRNKNNKRNKKNFRNKR